MVTFVQKHVRVSATPAACAVFAALLTLIAPLPQHAQAGESSTGPAAGFAVAGSTGAVTAGRIDARVSRNEVTPGEPFQLQLRSSGSGAPNDLSQPPDLRALESDFEILGTTRSVRVLSLIHI